jgi:hypothetical protein
MIDINDEYHKIIIILLKSLEAKSKYYLVTKLFENKLYIQYAQGETKGLIIDAIFDIEGNLNFYYYYLGESVDVTNNVYKQVDDIMLVKRKKIKWGTMSERKKIEEAQITIKRMFFSKKIKEENKIIIEQSKQKIMEIQNSILEGLDLFENSIEMLKKRLDLEENNFDSYQYKKL